MERRRHPRLAVELPIAFCSDEGASEGMVSGLSESGCTVTCEEKIEPGTLMDLRIQLPDTEGPMEVSLAVVRWAHGTKFGIEFLSMHPDEQDRLFDFVGLLTI